MRLPTIHRVVAGLRRVVWLAAEGSAAPMANVGAVRPVLFTIGYECHPAPESLVDALAQAGVQRLVDVRELPLSRRRGFSKSTLSEALHAAGMAYDHQRGLGNPKPYRDLYRTGQRDEGERLYRLHLRNGSAVAVDRLAETLHICPTCVLCFEHDHRECHREVIVQELQERLPELHVEHL